MRREKRSTIRKLESKANSGDVKAAFQLSEYYREGMHVEKDEILSKEYLNKAMEGFGKGKLRIKRLSLTNYRCLRDVQIVFPSGHDENLLVIYGTNGAGKSAILEAINASLSWISQRIRTATGNGEFLEQTDVHVSESYATVALDLLLEEDQKFDISLSVSSVPEKIPVKNDLHEFSFLSSLIKSHLTYNAESSLPLIAYYGVDRANAIEKKDFLLAEDGSFKTTLDWLNGYNRPSAGGANFREFIRWFKELSEIANENLVERENENLSMIKRQIESIKLEISRLKETDDTLVGAFAGLAKQYEEMRRRFSGEGLSKLKGTEEKLIGQVKATIEKFLPGYKNFRIQRKPKLDTLIDRITGGQILTLSVMQLSQGEKSLLALVADIVRRLVLLNPAAPEPLDGDGIILIDEIDLHLHPEWQQTVVPRLRKTFPNIQFIISTHSPQVLSTIPDNSIRAIGFSEKTEFSVEHPPARSYGMPSGEVLESVMQVDPQPPVEERQYLDRLAELVDDGLYGTVEAKKLIGELSKKLGAQHPKMLVIERSIRRQEKIHEMDKKDRR
jgi:predicted ATP-binding protein involved in virulence